MTKKRGIKISIFNQKKQIFKTVNFIINNWSVEYAEIFFRHDHVDLASVLYHVMRYIMHNKEYIIMYNMTHTHTCRGSCYQLGQRCRSRGWGASRGNSPAPLGTRNHSDFHWGFDGCRWQHWHRVRCCYSVSGLPWTNLKVWRRINKFDIGLKRL